MLYYLLLTASRQDTAIFPLILQANQFFVLRLLTPLAEYQSFLAITKGVNILEVA